MATVGISKVVNNDVISIKIHSCYFAKPGHREPKKPTLLC